MNEKQESPAFPISGATGGLGAGPSAGKVPQGWIASNRVIVNVWKTKNNSWIIKDCGASFKDKDFDKGFVEELVNKVMALPTRISVPRHFSELSMPRYYLIALDLEGFTVKNIVEIAGVRVDLSPTKWSYRIGYWHPKCQLLIASALKQLLGQKK